jgi:putative MATE family efflux protein
MDPLAREVVRLALPAFGALAAPSILLLTDAAFIGTLGTPALAGYAAGAAVFGVVVSLGYFLAYASTSVVARRFGADQPRAAVAEGINYISLGLIIGVIAGVTVWNYAETFASWIGVSAAALPHAVEWIRGAALGAPGMMAAMAAIGLFRGLQDTKVTFYVTVFQVLVNMVLCAALIFVADLGTYGAGLAVGVAETLGFLAYLWVLVRYARSIGVPAYPTHVSGLGSALRVGLPLLWRGFALRVVLTGATVVAARMGDHELAAFQVSLTTWYVLSNLLDAMAIASQAIIGRRLGASEGHLVHDIVRQLLRWSGFYGAILGVITIVLSPIAPHLFSGDAEVRHLMMLCLIMVGIHQPLAAVVFLLDGVLIGSGDTLFLAFALTMAMCTFLAIAWAVVHFELGVIGLWSAMIAFLATRAVLMFRRSTGDAWIVEGATR